MIESGIVSATFRTMKKEDIVDLCVDNNLSLVEWSENAHVFPADIRGAAGLRKLCLDRGLGIAAYGSYYRLGNQERVEDTFREILCSAEALGAPVIRVWAGTKASADVDDAIFRQLAAEASFIADMAREKGIRIAFEWHKGTLTDTNESALRLVEEASNANLCFLWQPTVALSMQERCAGLSEIGERLVNLHVYYWDEAGKRRPLSEGEDAWEKYFSCIRGDHGALLEFVLDNSVEQFVQDAAALNSWIRKFC